MLFATNYSMCHENHCIFSTFLLSDTLHICNTRGQYIKLDTTKALNIENNITSIIVEHANMFVVIICEDHVHCFW